MTDYEVELKFPIAAPADVAARLTALGASRGSELAQADQYFAHPVRRFEQTDEALRIRTEGEHNCLTYKGPLLDRATKTRQEIELDVASGPEGSHRLWAILRALGFVDVFTVRKRRTVFKLRWEGRDFSLSLDVVEQLGDFLEIETMAGPNDWEAARDCALRLAAALDLTTSERRSYLQLLLAQTSQVAAP